METRIGYFLNKDGEVYLILCEIHRMFKNSQLSIITLQAFNMPFDQSLTKGFEPYVIVGDRSLTKLAF